MTKKSRYRRVSGRKLVSSDDNAPLKTVELMLGEPVHGGACVARDDDGQVVFVRLGIPGERVIASITSEQSKFSWAEVVEVLDASSDRVTPDWRSQLGEAAGAELSHISVEAQRRWKRQVLKTQLRRVGGIDVWNAVEKLVGPEGPVVNPVPGDESDTSLLGRRTRAKFVVTKEHRLGMRKYRSHEVIALDDFALLDPVFTKSGVFSEGSEWSDKFIPGNHIELIAPTGSDPIILSDKIAWNTDGKVIARKPRHSKKMTIPTFWNVEYANREDEFEVTAGTFWQVHPKAPETLVHSVMKLTGANEGHLKGKKVIELYSGSGLFTKYLSEKIGPDGKIVSLESSRDAVRLAEKNCRSSEDEDGVENAEFYQGLVEAESVSELTQVLGGNVDLILLDPPREGAGAKVIAAIGDSSAKEVVLLACDPAAAARDISGLLSHGFRLKNIEAWDMFPHTHHFETIAVFDR